MWMKNGVEPDQLADLDLQCFQKRVEILKTLCAHGAY